MKLHFDYLNFRTKSSFLIHSEMPHINSLFTPVTIAPGVHDVQQALLHTTELTTLIMTTCFDEKKNRIWTMHMQQSTYFDMYRHNSYWSLIFVVFWPWYMYISGFALGLISVFFSKSMWFKNEIISKISEKGVNHSISKDSSRISLAW